MKVITTTGWGWPLGARFEHFFVNGASLCGHWQRDRETLTREHVIGPPCCPICDKQKDKV